MPSLFSNPMGSTSLGFMAAAGSVALLVGAFTFQVLGYAPCAMCIWQRYPHVFAIAIGALFLVGFRNSALLGLGALAVATTSGIGIYHTGVERGWWQGPTSCTGSGLDLSNTSIENLLPTAPNQASDLVMCDQVVWQFLSLSMASWNALLSAVLTGVWLFALVQSLKSGNTE